jgi:hypothetical protein
MQAERVLTFIQKSSDNRTEIFYLASFRFPYENNFSKVGK